MFSASKDERSTTARPSSAKFPSKFAQRWIGSHSGRDRLSEPSDPVRVEIETALHKRKPLIPVLVMSARMPTVEHLPAALHDFAYRNAVTVDAAQDFDVHMARLIRAIDRIAKSTPADGPVKTDAATVR